MRVDSTKKVHVTMREILSALGINGEMVSCGFNSHQSFSDMLDKELTITIKTKDGEEN